jgi:hypothetical protein
MNSPLPYLNSTPFSPKSAFLGLKNQQRGGFWGFGASAILMEFSIWGRDLASGLKESGMRLRQTLLKI